MQRKHLVLLSCIFLTLLAFSSCAHSTSVKTVQEQGVAMGSAVEVKAYGSAEQTVRTALQDALHGVSALDSQYLSKSVQTSALYRLNHAAHTKPTEVPPILFDALEKTKAVYAKSGGMAALSSGALTEIWGMDTDAFRVPSAAEIQAAKALCDDSRVELKNGTVTFAQGQILNLGSVGKGMACDTALQSLHPALQNGTIQGAVVSVGGSIGTLGTPPKKDSFEIGIRNPFGNANSYFASLSVGEAFLSTSGTYEKQFTADGKTYHHLLDLHTGYPKETNLVSVTVCAPSGLLSDALSTLCFLVGEQAAMPVLQEYGAQAIFVYQDKSVHVSAALQSAFTLRDTAFKAVSFV